MVGSGVGILKWCIHTLLTLTRGHSTTLRDATLKPRTRSTWSLYSLYSLDALTLTPVRHLAQRRVPQCADRAQALCRGNGTDAHLGVGTASERAR